MADALKVTGVRNLIRAADRAGKETKKEVRDAFRDIGKVVRTDAEVRFSRYDVKSAQKYRVVVRQRGVSVEQALNKTTGLRPDFGALQMKRALIPALDENESEVDRRMEHAIERVCEQFNHLT